MSTLSQWLYGSPLLMGAIYLCACAIASTSILYFCRPSRGPGYWAACCWLLALAYTLYTVEAFAASQRLGWLIDLLLVLAQAFMMLGVFRFLGQPLPFWIIAASAVPMLLMDLWRLFGQVPQALVDATYSAIIVGLALKPLINMRHAREHVDVRAVRNFIVGALLAYALAHTLRLLLGLYLGLFGDHLALFAHDSIPLLSFYSGLPFLVIALVALTAMSLHRTLAESRDNAELARAHLKRFEKLMRIGSAATVLLRDGRIVDSNPKLGELFGCRSDTLHGRTLAELFQAQADAWLPDQAEDQQPKHLIAVRCDQSLFHSEVTHKRLDERLELAEIRDVSRQKALEAQLIKLARTDPLTGALNRRAFNERFHEEQVRARRQGSELCLALIDLDHFKQINDHYGHSTGDEVLVQFSQLCRELARSNDVFARFGGEEFVLLLPECNAADASSLLGRLREALAERTLANLPGVTFSAGVSPCPPGQSLDQVLQQVDEALYRAKRNGRNRVERAGA